MAMMKLSLQTLMPVEDISAMFDFVEVRPYQVTEFYGLSIEASLYRALNTNHRRHIPNERWPHFSQHCLHWRQQVI